MVRIIKGNECSTWIEWLQLYTKYFSTTNVISKYEAISVVSSESNHLKTFTHEIGGRVEGQKEQNGMREEE
jgi:hypothetical protein